MTKLGLGVVLLIALSLASAAPGWTACGDGTLDGGEQCDLGAGNGTASTCCTNLCEFRAVGLTCRPSAGSCDIAETCTGTSATCPADMFRPSNFICRPSADLCDVQETCTGSTAACPSDGVQSAGAFCRPSAGACDLSEFCDGSSTACPPDAKSSAECRAAVLPCDVAETCDGVGNNCPADGVASSSTVCRPSAGACDVVESCTGSNPNCPADGFEPSGTPCRTSAGVCDPAESCTGTSSACPPDGKSTALCRASAGVCDVAESCDGVGDDCPADGKSSAQCRGVAGPCDLAETCDGLSDACPGDGFEPSSTVCRPSSGACDAVESCTGSSASCPPDGKSTSLCRAAAGACDVAESCDGVSNGCPVDAFVPAGTECRPAAPQCDVAESCTGIGPACPTNSFLPDGSACNDGIDCTADACGNGACVGTPDLDVCLDDFLCYKAKTTQSPPLPVVHLEDQLEMGDYTVRRGRDICTPANKNGSGVVDLVTHLRSYQIKAVSGSPKHQRRTLITIANQLGSLQVDTVKPDLLLVPVNKDLIADPSPPNPLSHDVDHYKCYKIKVSPGTPRFPKDTPLSLSDQFTSPPRSFLLKKIRHLCIPASKNGEAIKNGTAHLVCYKAKGGVPKHVKRIGVHLAGQFGVELIDTAKEDEICIPSTKAL